MEEETAAVAAAALECEREFWRAIWCCICRVEGREGAGPLGGGGNWIKLSEPTLFDMASKLEAGELVEVIANAAPPIALETGPPVSDDEEGASPLPLFFLPASLGDLLAALMSLKKSFLSM